MNWALAAGSLAAVLALAGIARLLGLGGAQRLADADEAIALAQALVSGFDGKAALVSTDGASAIVAGGPGDLVRIDPLGAHHRATRYANARVISLETTQNSAILTLSPFADAPFACANDSRVSAFVSALA